MFDFIVGDKPPGSPRRGGRTPTGSPNFGSSSPPGSPKGMKGKGGGSPKNGVGYGEEEYEDEYEPRPVWQACLVVITSPLWLPVILACVVVGGIGMIIFTLLEDIMLTIDGFLSPEQKYDEDGNPVKIDKDGKTKDGADIETIEEEFHHVDHGRFHFTSENLAFQDDPFVPVFKILDRVQELALPLLLGVMLSMVIANAAPDVYRYAFTAECTDNGFCNVTVVMKDDDKFTTSVCVEYESTECKRWLMSDCKLFDSDVTLHFVANDIIMAFYFGLAMKEVTEALLPGGSLNPPTKAINPILTTVGGVLGSVCMFFVLLEIFISSGLFDTEMESGCGGDGCTWDELSKGWGMVTATDIILAWIVGRVVFGDGHPAIDYLLLLAVADDAIAMVIIAVFYPDPNKNVQPVWLLLVLAGMLCAYLLRKWHFRKERATHQAWVPYILIGGLLSWIGLMKAHLHPALALVPIVPFMPGPNRYNLEHLEDEMEDELEEEALEMDHTVADAHDIMDRRKSLDQFSLASKKSFDDGTPPPTPPAMDYIDDHDSTAMLSTVLHQHHEHSRGRGISIQAGLYAGLVGHGVEDALKVEEYDEDGNMHLYISTLDEFEHFFKVYVDIGLGIFAMVNAGVKIDGLGAMSALVPLSLLIGKTGGVILMDRVSHWLGFPAPLGIRSRHVRMIGLIASLSLTGALFVAEVAFPTDETLKGHSKIGALLSVLVGFACWGFAQFQNFKEEDVVDQAHIQVEEEVAEEEKRMDESEKMGRRRSVSGESLRGRANSGDSNRGRLPSGDSNHSNDNSRDNSRATSRDASREGSPMPGLSLDDVELAIRPKKLVKRDQAVEADLTGGSAASPSSDGTKTTRTKTKTKTKINGEAKSKERVLSEEGNNNNDDNNNNKDDNNNNESSEGNIEEGNEGEPGGLKRSDSWFS